jgi:serine/threonine protein kinase
MVVEAVGRYRLLKKLANGNMGEVFLAEYGGEAGFRRRVVVKRLFQHLVHHPEAVRMFHDEAHVLSSLNHPSIPQVYDLGYADGHWYLVIEHVPGHTLAELAAAGARSGVPMPLDAVVAALEQLCDALHHAHERCDEEGRPLRIVHRDVTPHNVMVTPDGFAKLLDFGVAHTAREELSKGAAGGLKGTLAYMAPEQVRGQRLDKRSDVFAVGVVLYELTTGRRLFAGNEVEVMTSIVERDVTPPSSWLQGYPLELEKIVLTALSRDRARRYPSALHFARALEDYTISLGVVATHQTLARYYQQVFTEQERFGRTTGAYRATGVGTQPPAPPGSSGGVAGSPPGATPSGGFAAHSPSGGFPVGSPAAGFQGARSPAAGFGTQPPMSTGRPASIPPAPPRSSRPPPASEASTWTGPGNPYESGRHTSQPKQGRADASPLDDLRAALRAEPPAEQRHAPHVPHALHLPGRPAPAHAEETPLVLSRPKK